MNALCSVCTLPGSMCLNARATEVHFRCDIPTPVFRSHDPPPTDLPRRSHTHNLIPSPYPLDSSTAPNYEDPTKPYLLTPSVLNPLSSRCRSANKTASSASNSRNLRRNSTSSSLRR
ncbi:hypothetical protein BU23DRAFT_332751 [Bimuria novae-zelandiae CBS 107.79]|uniref:Uncharacterized protein n=1 Tax=Bimuria novae-zelandiae CBS 107.79 TaxID=1447943 RepID=A0A6A5UYB7_9PLEO|nr:hypothetical protein BU23DRAFT_332751 [Bimuria novae-zelandiae CBS 107.79]